MISARYKCIFVRISKTASTSVLEAFKRQKSFDRGFFGTAHYTLEHYKDTYPRQYDRYFKFAFVRNPWDRIYSLYRYQRYNQKFEIADCTFGIWLHRCEQLLKTPDRALFGHSREIFERHMTHQLDWVTVDGKIEADFIGRFEDIAEGFAHVCEQTGADLKLEHVNASVHKHDYREAYTRDMMELVAQWHSRDIERFGYKFG